MKKKMIIFIFIKILCYWIFDFMVINSTKSKKLTIKKIQNVHSFQIHFKLKNYGHWRKKYNPTTIWIIIIYNHVQRMIIISIIKNTENQKSKSLTEFKTVVSVRINSLFLNKRIVDILSKVEVFQKYWDKKFNLFKISTYDNIFKK